MSALPTEENSASSSAKRCCSNCDGEFEAVDVTAEARAIMRCVQALRGRFGKTTVVDVLRGADTENLRQWGLVNLPVYGTSEARRALLMEVVELLAADGYLAITEGKFPLVGFGPATVRPLSPILRCASSRRRRCARGARPNPPKAAVLAPPIWERRTPSSSSVCAPCVCSWPRRPPCRPTSSSTTPP